MSVDTIDAAIARAQEDLEFLEDWEQRYAHLIDLGRGAPGLDASERVEANRIRGCVSQVWLVARREPTGRISFRGESDSHLVNGLVALMLAIFSDRTPGEILSIEPAALFQRLGLAEALTPQRSNGLAALAARIQSIAREAHAQPNP